MKSNKSVLSTSHVLNLFCRSAAEWQQVRILALCLTQVLLAANVWAGKPSSGLTAPSNLRASAVSSSQINLAWQNNAGNATSIGIQRASGSSGPWSLITTVAATTTSYGDSGLNATTTYYYRVYASNSKGSSPYSSVASAITQGGAPACSYALSSSSASFTSGAGSGSIGVTATAGCGWSATTAAPWLHTTSSGTGNGSVGYTVDANTSTSSRSATITVGGQVFTVSQSGVSCTFSLSSSSASVGAAGGSGSVGVTAGAGCGWGASSASSWVHTTSSGSGNGTASYTVDPNSSSGSRNATITVAGQNFTITQSGHAQPVANAGPSQNTSVGANVSLNGSASASYDGATITSYNWVFGDLSSASGMSVTHSYSGSGTFTATLTVSDSFGATASGSTTITVTNVVAAPTVTMTAPGSGATVSGTVTLTATASASTVQVAFYCDNQTTPMATVTGSSSFSATCDTTTLPNGSHNFYAKASDSIGNSGTSPNLPVTVNNTTSTSTPGQFQWMLAMGGSVLGDEAMVNSVVSDHAGNIIVAGQFRGAVKLGDGTTRNSTGGTGYYDGFIVKYDSTGHFVWAKSFGGSMDDMVNSVAVDSANNIIVVGQISSSVDLGGGPLTVFGNADMFVAKFSASGSHIWSKSFGETANDWAKAVAVDGNGNVIVGGVVAYGSVDFGGGAVSGTGQQNAVLFKLNANGGYLWSERFSCAGLYDGTVLKSLAIDSAGDVVVAGNFSGTANFGGGSAASVGGADSFVAKYSGATGAFSWSKVLSGSGWDGASGVATDPGNGDVVITGTFAGSEDFGGGAQTTQGGSAIYIARYSSGGAYKWALTFGGGSGFQDAGNSVAVASDGRVAVTGQIASAVDFGGGWLFGNGAPNYFATEFNSTGQYVWSTRVLPAMGFAVTFDSSGNTLTGGYCAGSVDFGGGAVNIGGAGKSAFTTSYSK